MQAMGCDARPRHTNGAAPTKVSADASSHGLGTVLFQQIDSVWRPVSSLTECRYAQIEKEALATT